MHGDGVGGGLGVRVSGSSLFHDEKFAFFDFGVRGTAKIWKICLQLKVNYSAGGVRPIKIRNFLGRCTPWGGVRPRTVSTWGGVRP